MDIEFAIENYIPVPESGCYLWESSCQDTKRGREYGQVRINGKIEKAHRAIYKHFFGEIHKDMVVMHKCDVPCCINPEHLILGTHQENMNDMVGKGRQKTGTYKLSKQEVIDIFYKNGTAAEIAKDYNIHFSMVWMIKKRKRWTKYTSGLPERIL